MITKSNQSLANDEHEIDGLTAYIVQQPSDLQSPLKGGESLRLEDSTYPYDNSAVQKIYCFFLFFLSPGPTVVHYNFDLRLF